MSCIDFTMPATLPRSYTFHVARLAGPAEEAQTHDPTLRDPPVAAARAHKRHGVHPRTQDGGSAGWERRRGLHASMRRPDRELSVTRDKGRAAGSGDAIARERRASPPLAAASNPAFATASLPSVELLPVRIEHVLGSQSGHNLPVRAHTK